MFVLSADLPENVIMTDDPLRLRMLCAHHLDDARLVSELRGSIVYTGFYRNKPLAIMSCGYGQAPAMLHIEEAYRLGARCFLYLGECISLAGKYPLMDTVAAQGSSPGLVDAFTGAAGKMNAAYHISAVYTDDLFPIGNLLEGIAGGCALYAPPPEDCELVDCAHTGAALISNALGAQFLSLLVVAENRFSQAKIEESVRQSGFHTAALLAFETISNFAA